MKKVEKKDNKKIIFIVLAVVAVIIILIVVWGVSTYNGLVSLKEDVTGEYANIEVQLERRADLVPNLVNTVEGYVKHESSVIKDITSARERLIYADDIEDKAKANSELTRAIDALMVVVENYPDLKANTNFINLQDELAGTENRIATARRDYNEIAKKYNSKIKRIPTNIIAEIGEFDDVDYFEASADKTSVPEVDFDD